MQLCSYDKRIGNSNALSGAVFRSGQRAGGLSPFSSRRGGDHTPPQISYTTSITSSRSSVTSSRCSSVKARGMRLPVHDAGPLYVGPQRAPAGRVRWRSSGVAQSLVQRTPVSGAETERFAFAQGDSTVGQRVRTIAGEAWRGLLTLVEHLLAQGRSCDQLLEVLMPA